MKKLKNQRGSVTLFILIAVLFFTIILLSIYKNNVNRLRTQDEDISQIEKAYEKNIEEAYEKAIEKEQEQNRENENKVVTVSFMYYDEAKKAEDSESREVTISKQEESSSVIPPEVKEIEINGKIAKPKGWSSNENRWKVDIQVGENIRVTKRDDRKNYYMIYTYSITVRVPDENGVMQEKEIEYEVNSKGEVRENNGIELPENPREPDELGGWILEGWTKGEDPTGEVIIPKEEVPEDGKEYHPKFRRDVTITFDYNGGGGEIPETQTGTVYGNDIKIIPVEITIPNEELVKEGSEFLGWSEERTATESTYNKGETYEFKISKTIYAVWKDKDEEAPVVEIEPNGNEKWSTKQEAKVTVTDNKKLKEESLKYIWKQSKEEPRKEEFVETFKNGEKITISEGSGNDWYLWIYAEDEAGNIAIERSKEFYLDNTLPTSDKPEVKEGVKNITVTINQEDEHSGINNETKQYAIKEASDSEWKWEIDSEDIHVFTELKSNTEYDIKTKVEDNAGNEKESEITKVTTLNITPPTIEIEPEEWTNTEVTIRITYPEIKGFTKQYSFDNLTWEEYTFTEENPLKVSENKTVYARSINEDNEGEDIVSSKTIEKIDSRNPEIKETEIGSITEEGTVTLTGKAIDNESGITGWAFTTKENLEEESEEWEEVDIASKTEMVQTKTITEAGIWYFYVKDRAGNISKSEAINVDEVYNSIEVGISYEPEEDWSKTKEVTITYPEIKGLKIEYSIGDKNNYVPYEKPFSVDSNTTIYVKSTINGREKEYEKQIEKVDSVNPEIKETKAGSLTEEGTITLTGKAIDNESGIIGWAFTTKESLEPELEEWEEVDVASSTEMVQTKTITEAGIWYFYVKDRAENISRSEAINLEEVYDSIEVEINYEPERVWSKTKEITITYPKLKGLSVEYSIGDKNNYVPYEDPFSVDSNTTIYVKSTINGREKEYEKQIEKVDSVNPEIKEAKTETLTEEGTVTLTGKAIDNESGIMGWAFTTKETLEEESKEWKEVDIASSTEMVQTKTITEVGIWYFYVKDRAGNISRSEAINVDEVYESMEVEINYEPEGIWSKTKEVTITYPEIKGLKIEYSIGDKSNYTPYVDPFSVDTNTTIYVKSTINGQEKEYEKQIEKVDSVKPEIKEAQTGPLTEEGTITLTGKAIDNESGIIGWAFTTKETLELESEEWEEVDIVPETETIQTKTMTEAGIWYFYVKDRAGNISRSEAINVDEVYDSMKVEINYEPEGVWSKTKEVTITYPEIKGLKIEYSMGDKSNYTPYVDPFSVDSNTTIYVKSTINGQEKEYEKQIEKIDSTAPTISNLKSGETIDENGEVSLTAEVKDDESGVKEYQFSNNETLDENSEGWLPITTENNNETIPLSGVATDEGTWYLYVKDVVGNYEKQPVEVLPSCFDSIEPKINFDAKWSRSKKVTITFPEIKGLIKEYSITGEDGYIISESNVVEIDIEENNTQILAKSTLSGTEISRIVTDQITTIDRINPGEPTIEVQEGKVGKGDWYTSDVKLSITPGIDNESGPEKTSYIVTGAQNITETDGNTVTITEEGTSYITAYTYDVVGNKSVEKQFTVNKDSVAPKITLTQRDNEIKDYSKTIDVSIIEDTSKIQTKKYANRNRDKGYFAQEGTQFEGDNFIADSMNADISNRATPESLYSVYVEDNAGNSTIETINIQNLLIDIEMTGKYGVLSISPTLTVDDNGIITFTDAGTQYGPYWKLPVGKYEVTYTGENLPTAENGYLVSTQYNKYDKFIEFARTNQTLTSTQAKFTIEVTEELEGMEIKCFGTKGTIIKNVRLRQLDENDYEASKVIAYYDAENNTGKGIFDKNATTWKDLSGNNYDMTFNNINKTNTSGWVDNSMMLDGVDDYLTISSNLNLSKYNDVSVAATYKVLTQKGNTTGLLCSSTPTEGRLFIGYGSANQLSSNFTVPDTWMGSMVNAITLGKTANVVYTFKGKNSNSKNSIYKNAVNVMTNNTAMTCNWATHALEVGRSWGGSDPTYYTANVQIYNLMIYNGTLTDYQIKKIYNEAARKYEM